MNYKVFDFYMEFMNKGFTVLKKSGYSSSVSENQFSTFLEIMGFIQDQFKDLSRALEISFILGASIASLLILFSFVDFLIDFKSRVSFIRLLLILYLKIDYLDAKRKVFIRSKENWGNQFIHCIFRTPYLKHDNIIPCYNVYNWFYYISTFLASSLDSYLQ